MPSPSAALDRRSDNGRRCGRFSDQAQRSAETPSPSAAAASWQAAQSQIGGPFTLWSETGETVTEADVYHRADAACISGLPFCQPMSARWDTVRNAEAGGYHGGPTGYFRAAARILVLGRPAQRDTPEVWSRPSPRNAASPHRWAEPDDGRNQYRRPRPRPASPRVYYRINREGDTPITWSITSACYLSRAARAWLRRVLQPRDQPAGHGRTHGMFPERRELRSGQGRVARQI